MRRDFGAPFFCSREDRLFGIKMIANTLVKMPSRINYGKVIFFSWREKLYNAFHINFHGNDGVSSVSELMHSYYCEEEI